MDKARIAWQITLSWVWLASTVVGADRWPEWRGETGQGLAAAENVPLVWSETENVAWKTPLPGHGWSTPVIANGHVWVTTAIDIAAPPEQAAVRRKTSTNSQPLTISDSVSLRVIGVDLATGRIHTEVELLNQTSPQMIHVDNSYATPSPVLANGRLYCYYGPCGMARLDLASKEVLWTNQSLVVKHENGAASSPILWNDRIILHCDGIDQQYIIAIDCETGEPIWKTSRSGQLNNNPQLRKSYATPLVVTGEGGDQIVSPAADWVYGYDPESGEELWRLPYGVLGFSNAARPVADDGWVFIATGYMKSELLAIRLEEDEESGEFPAIAWRFRKQVPNVGSPILSGGLLFFASDNGIATCLDATTGEIQWSQRIGKRFWASPLCAEGRIYFFDQDGTTTVVDASATFRQLAVNALPGRMMATAAAVDDALVIRTEKALYRIGQSTLEGASP